MIFIKSEEEIELLRESNLLVGKTLGEVAKHIRPGVSTLELDRIAEEYIRSQGAEPGFKGYGGFPNTLCISVNDVVVHGIPSARCILQEGDVVSVDCGTLKNGAPIRLKSDRWRKRYIACSRRPKRASTKG